MKYVIYARKSSEAKERQALSISDQLDECKTCAAKNNLRIDRTITESKSAFKPSNRQQFDGMLELIEKGKIEGILTWKLDRLCRNPKEGGYILQLLQDGVLKEIRTATGEIYTQDSDHLVLQIHFGMSNQYSRNLSQNVKRGLTHKARRGEYPRRAPLGYIGYGNRGQRRIKPDDFEAPIIRQLFELAAYQQYSLNQISEYALNKGLSTKSGKKLSKNHIYSILNNQVYYGTFYYNSEAFTGQFTPIITKRLYDAAQVALGNRSKPKIHIWKDYSYYNGLVHCGNCGCSITTTVKQKYYKLTDRTAKYIYHHCTKRKGVCHQTPILPSELEAELLKQMERIAIDEEVWELGIKLLKAKHKEETEANAKRQFYYQDRYNSLTDKLNRLIAMRADEELNRDEFLSQKQLLLEEQTKVKEFINDNEDSSAHWLELAENFLETALRAKSVMKQGSPLQKRELILAVGENLTLKDKKIDIQFKKPYDVLLKPTYRTNVLGLVNYVGTYYQNYLY